MLSFLPAKYAKVLRFLISGGSSATVNLTILYICTDIFHIWYVASAIIAFCISFVVSFTLQKWWTFADKTTDIVHRQLTAYLTIALINLSVGTLLLFAIVELTGLHYLAAQIIVQGMIAIMSFFIYSRVLFAAAHARPHFLASPREFFARFTPISLTHFVVLCAFVALLAALPFLGLWWSEGLSPTDVPVSLYATGNYYLDRIHEMQDGRIFMGNPYFIEHAGKFPPAFFAADWVSAVPFLLGIPWLASITINLVVWSLVFLLLAYWISRALEFSPRFSLFGALVVYTSVYVFMAAIVSMQAIFPSFLLFLFAYLLWLKDPHFRGWQIFLALAAAYASYLYSYTVQIIIVTLLLTALAIVVYRRGDLKSFARAAVIYGVLLAPFIIFSALQVQQPFYFETMERIGLVYTHLPISFAFVVSLWPLLVGALALAIRSPREWLRDRPVPVFFFAITGATMVGVIFSHVVTGKDLELPQHIERFVVVWFAFASLYFAARERAAIRSALRSFPKNILVALLLLGIIAGNVYFLKRYAPRPSMLPFAHVTSADVERAKETERVMQWLSENIAEPAVIWADPDGAINNYTPFRTKHYMLFSPSAVLQLLPSSEMEERYLTAHYFALSAAELLEEYQEYAGAGHAEHAHKTHNRRVKVCRRLQLERFGHECGELTDLLHHKGEAYFNGLYARHQKEIRPNISDLLAKYSVDYIVADKLMDSKTFHPETLPGTKEIYSDERFTVYKYK
jgi:putative flippase GtrA